MQADDNLIIIDWLAEDHGPADRSDGFKMPTESLGSVDPSGPSDPGGVGNDNDRYKAPLPEATATDGPALLGLKLYGGDGDDTLNGGLFHDKLYGGGGDDTLNGGANGDLLDGGPGQDVLTGGPGGDTFVFGMDGYGPPVVPWVFWYEHESTVSNPDYINDFSQAEGDKIDLSEIGWYTAAI